MHNGTLQLYGKTFFADLKPVFHTSSSQSSQHNSLLTWHVTVTHLDLNKCQMQVGDAIVRLLVKLILLWVCLGEVVDLAPLLKAVVVISASFPILIIYMAANICQSGKCKVLQP